MTRIAFESSAVAWPSFRARLRRLLDLPGVRRVCEVGGGREPAVSPQDLAEHDVECTLLDISSEELDKAPLGYEKVHGDIAAPDLDLPARYDLVASRMVAEHIPDPEAFHRNVRRLLVDGGLALHFFPTLYALPFVFNRVLPEPVVGRLLSQVQSADCARPGGKWPALYRWCRGPGRRQLRRLECAGYEVEEYIGFFGHYYYKRLGLLQHAENRLAAALLKRPVPALTSYAYVLLRSPPDDGHPPFCPRAV